MLELAESDDGRRIALFVKRQLMKKTNANSFLPNLDISPRFAAKLLIYKN